MKNKKNNNDKSKINKIFSFIKIDFSFFITFFVSLFLGEIKLYICFLVFMLFHEASHYFVAKKLGYMAKRVHLTIFGASLEGLDDFTLQDELKVIFAGPLLNLFVIILCYLSFWFFPESYEFLNEILTANLSLFVFNMLPIYPLDFGRIILVHLTKNNQRKDALKKTKTISFCFIMVLFLVFFISLFFKFNFSLGFVSINLLNLLFQSSDGSSFKRELFVLHKAKLLKKGLSEKNIYLFDDTQFYQLFKFIDDYHFFNFIFLNKNFEIQSKISEIELYKKTGFL